LAEYAADAAPGSAERKFVYAEYIDEPVMMLATSGATTTPYYYHQNSLYSVAALTDASGTVVERYAYSAYGKPIFLDASANLLDPQASTIGNPYLFTGRRLDEETGLYYYRARMYDAALGRFVSRDPIGYEAGDVSLYRYVFNCPIGNLDPSGGEAVDPTGGGGTNTSACMLMIAIGHTRWAQGVIHGHYKHRKEAIGRSANETCFAAGMVACQSGGRLQPRIPDTYKVPGWPSLDKPLAFGDAAAYTADAIRYSLESLVYFRSFCGEPCCCRTIEIRVVCDPEAAWVMQNMGNGVQVPYLGVNANKLCGDTSSPAKPPVPRPGSHVPPKSPWYVASFRVNCKDIKWIQPGPKPARIPGSDEKNE